MHRGLSGVRSARGEHYRGGLEGLPLPLRTPLMRFFECSAGCAQICAQSLFLVSGVLPGFRCKTLIYLVSPVGIEPTTY
jgi:hypothetical protein